MYCATRDATAVKPAKIIIIHIFAITFEKLIRKMAQIYYLQFYSSKKKQFNSVYIYNFIFFKRKDFFIKLKIIRLMAKNKNKFAKFLYKWL
jgi:hypothetical protein